MIKKRGLASLIVLSIVTLGIYACFWISSLAKDINTMCAGDGKKTGGFLKYFFLGFITLGIYDLIWIYKVGERLQDNGSRYGVTIKEGGNAILLWYLLGSFIVVGPFVAMHLVIKNTNTLAAEYNKQHRA